VSTLNQSQKAFSDIRAADEPLPLSDRQREVYEYLRQVVAETGQWPTYREVCDHFGWSSDNTYQQLLKTLVQKGWIERKERGVYHFVTGTCPHCGQEIEA